MGDTVGSINGLGVGSLVGFCVGKHASLIFVE